MSSLVPCPSCQRHVRAGSATCPFCAGILDPTLQPNAVPTPLRSAGRIGVFLAGAIAVSSCCGGQAASPGVVTLQPDGSGGEQGGGQTGGGGSTNNGGGQPQPIPPAPAYGAPPPMPPPNTGGGGGDGSVHPMYGVAPFNESD